MQIVHHLAHRVAVVASVVALGSTSAQAVEAGAPADQSVSMTWGTFGASAGYEQRFGNFWGGHWGTRLLANSGGVRVDSGHGDLSGNHYDTKVKTGAGISSLLDYYPSLDSGWHLTGGVIISRVKNNLTGRPDEQGNYNINNHVYSAAQVGTLKGQMKYNPTLLYAGGGWESAAAGTKGWRFVSDAGVFVSGKAKTTLTATGAATNPALQADLNAERGQISKRHTGAMLQLGAAYAF